MVKIDKKGIISALVVGTAVVIGAPLLGGILNTVLAIVPSITLGGISVPHGVIAAGAVAFVANLLVEKFL